MAIVAKTLKPCSHLHEDDNIVTIEECAAVGVAHESFILESDKHGPAGELEEATPIDDWDDVEMCSVAFEFKIPDAWRSANFIEEKTNKDLYRGPKWLYVDVRNEHVLDHLGNVLGNSRKGSLDGDVYFTQRDQSCPIDPDFTRLRINAELNPMLASILYMNGDDIQRDHGAAQTWVKEFITPEGYMDTVMMIDDDLVVRNIYDQDDVMYDFDNKQFMLSVFTHFSGDEEVVWDDIRNQRDILLKASDASIAEDMPQSMKDDILVYRQLLRDLPDALSAFPASSVLEMLPTEPNSTITADYALKRQARLDAE